MKISMAKIADKLTPTTSDDRDKLCKLKDGYYVFLVTQIRCPIKHREFYGIRNLVFENLPEGADCLDAGELLDLVKIEMMTRSVKKGSKTCPAGRVNSKGSFIPKSLSFENMNQDEFDAFTTGAYRVMADWMGIRVLDLVEFYRNNTSKIK